MAALIISMGLATQPRSVAPWEVRPPAPAPRASESAASSLWPAGGGLTPTPPTPPSPPSLPRQTGTPAHTPTVNAVMMFVSSGKSNEEKNISFLYIFIMCSTISSINRIDFETMVIADPVSSWPAPGDNLVAPESFSLGDCLTDTLTGMNNTVTLLKSRPNIL